MRVKTNCSGIIEDIVWTDFYTTNYDVYLSSLKSVVRKGRPHPIVDARTRLAAHRRENLKTLGLKRVAKTLSLNEILAKDDQPQADGATGYVRSPRNPETGRFEDTPVNTNGTADEQP
jgi:hypothetical protein